MSEEASVAAALTAAGQSLRDTAKWFVGGVIATASGVFAGSSLTNLGTLDPIKDASRLTMAQEGALLGFISLTIIFLLSVRVFVRNSFTTEDIANAFRFSTLGLIRTRLVRRYSHRFPGGIDDLNKYCKALTTALDKKSKDPEDIDLLTKALVTDTVMSADAGLMYVRQRFTQLCVGLLFIVPAAAYGFGVFAWAANPPKPAPPPAAFSLSCTPAAQAICDRLQLK